MWQLNAFQEWYEAFSLAFPGEQAGHRALSDGGCQQQMSMRKISRDLRLVRRKCVPCCLARKGVWLFLPFNVGYCLSLSFYIYI